MRAWAVWPIVGCLLFALFAGHGNGVSDSSAAASEAGPAGYPKLVEIDGTTLRTDAVELEVPPHEFHIVRLILTPDVWGEELPWDGQASVEVDYSYRLEGGGVLMSAGGFAAPAFAEPEPIEAQAIFIPLEGDGSGGLWISSSCNACNVPPPHEHAWMIGGHDGPVTFRLGIAGEGKEDLWARDGVPVSPDAVTADAFAGAAFRYWLPPGPEEFQSGIMEATWEGGTELTTATSFQRTSSYNAQADIVEPGITSALLVAASVAGVDSWSYDLDLPGSSAQWSGYGVQHPVFLVDAENGLVGTPDVFFQGNPPAGPLRFTFDRTWSGQENPTSLGPASFEIAIVGHAGLDLDGLYGWITAPSVRPGEPSSAAQCHLDGARPEGLGAFCHGDPALIADFPR